MPFDQCFTGAAAAATTSTLNGGITIQRSLNLVKILAVDMKAFVVGQGYGTVRTLYDDFKDIGSALYRREFWKAIISIFKTAWNTIVPKYGYCVGSGYGRRQYFNDRTGIQTREPMNKFDDFAFEHDGHKKELGWVRDVWGFGASSDLLPTGPIGQAEKIIGTIPFAVGGLLWD